MPGNQAFERFPTARRIAFDPARGRLWAVCPFCRRWNLAPMDGRREALDDLERAAVDGGRVLASTGSIALVRVPGAELEARWREAEEIAAIADSLLPPERPSDEG